MKGLNGLTFGIEREYWITDREGVIVPEAPLVLPQLVHGHRGQFKYELSACQIETNCGPLTYTSVSQIIPAQRRLEDAIRRVLEVYNLKLDLRPVADEDMPLDVYPDPTGRYAKIASGMPETILKAACRIIGTHIHIGMPDLETALRVYNRVITECDALIHLGDKSGGERLRLYKMVKPDCMPTPYDSVAHFKTCAEENGYGEDLRNCWHLIRVTRFPTVEFRLFDATESLEELISWVKYCANLCLDI